MKLSPFFTTITSFSKILAAVLFVTLPFAGFYLGMDYQKKISPVVSDQIYQEFKVVSIPSPVIDPTANWKTYINNMFGYQIKYPPSWYLSEIQNRVSIFSTDPEKSGNLSGFQVRTFENNEVLSSLDWWYKQHIPLSEYNKQRYREFKKVNVGGFQGIILEPDVKPEGIAQTEVYLVNYKKVYQIIMSDDEYKQSLDEKGANSQILSTFKFLDRNETPDNLPLLK